MRYWTIGIAALLAVGIAGSTSAAKLSTLYSFCSKADCVDGAAPHGIAMDRSGKIFGTTAQPESPTGEDVVYELLAPGGGRNWHEKVLHNFCNEKSCRFYAPYSALTLDATGEFYGSTEFGPLDGTVFELVPDEGRGGWRYRQIYKLCSLPNCADGQHGDGAMAIDMAGNVYGVAYQGGAHGKGVVFELSPPIGGSGKWAEKVLYDFCSKTHCWDGDEPVNGLTYAGAAQGLPYDGTSPLYGTTQRGGFGEGVVFSLAPSGNGSWQENVLHVFCSQTNPEGFCTDAGIPAQRGPLAVDSSGDIIGATWSGRLYKLSPAGSQWRETTLFDFCKIQGCGDGDGFDVSNPIIDTSGNLYGATNRFAYKLTPSGDKFTILHEFCTEQDCANGTPSSALIMDADKNLYGTTERGGAYNNGTVFKITP